jgi:hypothetical protein
LILFALYQLGRYEETINCFDKVLEHEELEYGDDTFGPSLEEWMLSKASTLLKLERKNECREMVIIGALRIEEDNNNSTIKDDNDNYYGIIECVSHNKNNRNLAAALMLRYELDLALKSRSNFVLLDGSISSLIIANNIVSSNTYNDIVLDVDNNDNNNNLSSSSLFSNKLVNVFIEGLYDSMKNVEQLLLSGNNLLLI